MQGSKLKANCREANPGLTARKQSRREEYSATVIVSRFHGVMIDASEPSRCCKVVVVQMAA